MVATFWGTVGLAYFLAFKSDFEYESARDFLENRKYAQLCKQQGIDGEKEDFLREYVATLEKQINILRQ